MTTTTQALQPGTRVEVFLTRARTAVVFGAVVRVLGTSVLVRLVAGNEEWFATDRVHPL